MLSSRVCPSVRTSHAGIVSKRLDESSWVFWRGGFLPPVDRVVNKVRRRIANLLFVQGWLENHVTKTVEYVNIPRIARRPSKKYCDSRSLFND